jgi:hypothetical protein
MVATARVLHHVLAWALVAGLAVQIFLAGLGVFSGAENFATHRDFGHVLELLPILILVAAAVGRLGRPQIIMPLIIFGLLILQSALVALRESTPAVAALHPVNGFIVTYLAIQLAREAWARFRSRTEPPLSSPAASEAPGS